MMGQQLRAAVLAAMVGAAGLAGVAPTGSASAQTNPTFGPAIGGPGTSNGQLNSPNGVATDVAGNVYVADTDNHRVQKFARSGAFVAAWGERGVDPGTFDTPRGIAVGRDGLVYVADTSNHRVQKFTATGDFLGVIGEGGPNPNQLDRPRGVAADVNGMVYVLDTGHGRVQKYDARGAWVGSWGSTGTGANQLNGPAGIALDRDGNVVVADTSNNQVKTFSPSGALVSVVGHTGDGPGQFFIPQGVAVDTDGNLWVADTGNNRIQELSSTGGSLEVWGSQGTGVGQFSRPSALAVDSAGTVSIADTYNGRVQRMSKASGATPPSQPAQDTTAPTTTATVSQRPNERGWNAQAVTVTLAAADQAGGSGVKEIVYAVNGSSSTVTGSSADIAVTAEGVTTITYFARDNAGNQEAERELQKIKIDKTAPAARPGNRSPAPNTSGWNNADVTVAWTCEDNMSGSAAPGGSKTLKDEGANQSIGGACTDNAGNSASDALSGVSIDKTSPSVKAVVTPAPGASGWSTSDVTVALTAEDLLSGVAKLEYNLDNTAWAPYTAPVVIASEGRHSVAYRATDKADNTSPVGTQVVQIDKTKPTLTGAPTTNPNGNGWYNADVAIVWTCADNPGGTGIAGPCPSASSMSSEGVGLTVSTTVKDVAGNQTTATSPAVKIDKAKPTVRYGNHPTSYTLDQRVTITCTAADQPGLSGLASTTCQNIDAPAYTFNIGANTVSATATDKAGNVGSGSTSFTVTSSPASLANTLDQIASGSPEAEKSLNDLRDDVGRPGFANKVLKETAPQGEAPTKKQPFTYEQGQMLIKLHKSIFGF